MPRIVPSKADAVGPRKVKPKRNREELEESDSDSQSSSSQTSEEFQEGSSQDRLSDTEEVENDEGADAPRIVQWDDDDDLVYEQAEKGEEASKSPGTSKLLDLEKNLKSLPLGTLRTAQNVLYKAESDNESESDGDSGVSEQEAKRVKKERVKWTSKESGKKRANKNAPMEVTSKKPVTRNRTVVEVPKIVPRDPRFLPVAGEFNPEIFQKSYGFLAASHKSELQTLKENLRRARKLLSSSPRDQLAEREAEVERLEWAIKRAESLVNKDRQDAIQRDAMGRVKTEEKEKRTEGKGSWWLKKGEKREVFNRARFEAIAAEGGGRAVKKAIDKKQKKISQKEKKSRPYAKGKAFEAASAPRNRSRSTDAPPHKRRRVS